jgi:linoleoyl-CoA desaturase
VFNTFLGQLVTFEHCAFTYDRLLKKEGIRPKGDRSEIIKYVSFVAYQYVLFPAIAGPRWKAVLVAGVMATVIRNLILAGLQMGSSVGHEVSTEHDANHGAKGPGEWCRFQVETSKNWVVAKMFKLILGGLDRHIEHHLYSNLPPPRLHAVSTEVQALCRKHGIKYREYPTFLGSLRDSLSYLWLLSMPRSLDH